MGSGRSAVGSGQWAGKEENMRVAVADSKHGEGIFSTPAHCALPTAHWADIAGSSHPFWSWQPHPLIV